MGYKAINYVDFAGDRVVAAYTTRLGGHSKSPYDSFNLGLHVGDAQDDVLANRRMLEQEFAPRKMVYMEQVHGSTVRYVDSSNRTEIGSCDGIYTDDPALLLTVMVADCLPMLLASEDGKWVCALHCGWRCVSSGIIGKGIGELKGRGATSLRAFIGPGIGRGSFEVGPEVREIFTARDEGLGEYFEPGRDDRFMCDLRGICHRQLGQNGVGEIEDLDVDTFTDANFYSYRKEKVTGRQVCVIGKKN